MILKEDFSLSQLQISTISYKNRHWNQISLKKNCYSWLRQYITVENMRRRNDNRKEQKGKAQALVMAVETSINQSEEKNAQRNPGEKGWACYYGGKEGHLM